MIWLTKIRTGEAVGINPTEIKTIQFLDMYMSPREDAPNRVSDPRSPEGEGPWYGKGSHVEMKGKNAEGFGVEQSPGDIRALLEQHEARFMEGMRAARESEGDGTRSHGAMCPVRVGGECLCGEADRQEREETP